MVGARRALHREGGACREGNGEGCGQGNDNWEVGFGVVVSFKWCGWDGVEQFGETREGTYLWIDM